MDLLDFQKRIDHCKSYQMLQAEAQIILGIMQNEPCNSKMFAEYITLLNKIHVKSKGFNK
ncbi:hypothetical protein [Heyndrickxia sporothermodurans]|uniref:Uncharacterized protein n=1 Tax=Heyndrickxia sporothermodurans TaxID=46224 RepID=A0AB37HI30_9BACI|nr:hypothetical protein [Heyndrickxia sporothermodurans]MBL5772040.1 hypothetical protein [Heyndrickxia sporothermodurans]MBL5775623.1 hypothetical protein [Heyndrickxia sporothermodurans]MBL5797006.1 hypothetical protein [Heyndrickxia sporothermodurans]MBL5807368.1 hypothetical protein [Heyndrickxia sporothermodurans]MBL5811495.1 hypothetical protein [Heyndrickxia sporothermodurans]